MNPHEDEADEGPASVGAKVIPAEAQAMGKRLARLRKQCGLTQDALSDRTFEVAAEHVHPRTGQPRFVGLGRPYIVNMEAGRNQLGTERVRGVLALAFGITRDQLADYLDDVIALDDLLEMRVAASGQSSTPTTLCGRSDWPQIRATVKRIRPGLRDETLEEIADEPFAFGAAADADKIAHLAWGVQEWADREKARGGE